MSRGWEDPAGGTGRAYEMKTEEAPVASQHSAINPSVRTAPPRARPVVDMAPVAVPFAAASASGDPPRHDAAKIRAYILVAIFRPRRCCRWIGRRREHPDRAVGQRLHGALEPPACTPAVAAGLAYAALPVLASLFVAVSRRTIVSTRQGEDRLIALAAVPLLPLSSFCFLFCPKLRQAV